MKNKEYFFEIIIFFAIIAAQIILDLTDDERE